MLQPRSACACHMDEHPLARSYESMMSGTRAPYTACRRCGDFVNQPPVYAIHKSQWIFRVYVGGKTAPLFHVISARGRASRGESFQEPIFSSSYMLQKQSECCQLQQPKVTASFGALSRPHSNCHQQFSCCIVRAAREQPQHTRNCRDVEVHPATKNFIERKAPVFVRR